MHHRAALHRVGEGAGYQQVCFEQPQSVRVVRLQLP